MCNMCLELDELSSLEAVIKLSKLINEVDHGHIIDVLDSIALKEIESFNNDPDHNEEESLEAFLIATEIYEIVQPKVTNIVI